MSVGPIVSIGEVLSQWIGMILIVPLCRIGVYRLWLPPPFIVPFGWIHSAVVATYRMWNAMNQWMFCHLAL